MAITLLKIIKHFSETSSTHLEDDNMNTLVWPLLAISKKENSKHVYNILFYNFPFLEYLSLLFQIAYIVSAKASAPINDVRFILDDIEAQ